MVVGRLLGRWVRRRKVELRGRAAVVGRVVVELGVLVDWLEQVGAISEGEKELPGEELELWQAEYTLKFLLRRGSSRRALISSVSSCKLN